MAPSRNYRELLERRSAPRQLRLQQPLSPQQHRELADVTQRLQRETTRYQQRLQRDVRQIRAVMQGHRDSATLHLGGVPMIVADSIAFIRHDLLVFGAGVTAFRRPHWS